MSTIKISSMESVSASKLIFRSLATQIWAHHLHSKSSSLCLFKRVRVVFSSALRVKFLHYWLQHTNHCWITITGLGRLFSVHPHSNVRHAVWWANIRICSPIKTIQSVVKDYWSTVLDREQKIMSSRNASHLDHHRS